MGPEINPEDKIERNINEVRRRQEREAYLQQLDAGSAPRTIAPHPTGTRAALIGLGTGLLIHTIRTAKPIIKNILSAPPAKKKSYPVRRERPSTSRAAPKRRKDPFEVPEELMRMSDDFPRMK